MSRTKNNRGKASAPAYAPCLHPCRQKEFKNAVYKQYMSILNSFLTKRSQVRPAWTPEVQILPGAKNLPVIVQKHQLIIT